MSGIYILFLFLAWMYIFTITYNLNVSHSIIYHHRVHVVVFSDRFLVFSFHFVPLYHIVLHRTLCILLYRAGLVLIDFICCMKFGSIVIIIYHPSSCIIILFELKGLIIRIHFIGRWCTDKGIGGITLTDHNEG